MQKESPSPYRKREQPLFGPGLRRGEFPSPSPFSFEPTVQGKVFLFNVNSFGQGPPPAARDTLPSFAPFIKNRVSPRLVRFSGPGNYLSGWANRPSTMIFLPREFRGYKFFFFIVLLGGTLGSFLGGIWFGSSLIRVTPPFYFPSPEGFGCPQRREGCFPNSGGHPPYPPLVFFLRSAQVPFFFFPPVFRVQSSPFTSFKEGTFPLLQGNPIFPFLPPFSSGLGPPPPLGTLSFDIPKLWFFLPLLGAPPRDFLSGIRCPPSRFPFFAFFLLNPPAILRGFSPGRIFLGPRVLVFPP